MRKHYVTFLSPGTFVSEETRRPVASHSVSEAVGAAHSVTERHGAKPYAFYFTTVLAADPVPDGEGGLLRVEEREVFRSGVHYLGGKLLTLDDLEARGDPSLRILVSNMKANNWPIVVENNNSFVVVRPFEEGDLIVNAHPDHAVRARGDILRRGDESELVAYRARKFAEYHDALRSQT